MNKSIYTLIMCGVLASCGGDGGDKSSSSNESSSSVSSTVSTSSTTQTSSSSASSLSGSATAGRQTLKSACVSCHEDPEDDGLFEGVFSFDVNRFTYHTMDKYAAKNYTGASIQDLTQFISAEMPNCGPGCAEDAATYLWSLRGQTPVVQQFACDTSAPVLYGRRDLKLLTSYEYHNSLQALFDRPLPDDFSDPSRANDDFVVARMPNHAQEPVSEGRLTAYNDNARELAQWAIDTSGALSFNCFDGTTCASNFINEFAYLAFRRPLTLAEREEYKNIINEPQDLMSGLRWAIHSVLMSPQFLYRSELGTQVSAARNYSPEQPSDDDVTIGEPSVNLSMPQTSYGTDGMGEYGPYKYVQAEPNYNWTGDDIIVVRVKGHGSNGHFGLKVLNQGFEHTENLDFTNVKVLTLRVTGVTGDAQIQTFNQSGTPISVSQLVIGPATLPPTPQGTFPNLASANSNAFVLDAFEYASALSYMYTGSSPSRELLQAAFDGDLNNPSIVEDHIDDMLDSELGREHVGRMAGIWFRTDKVLQASRNGNNNFTQAVKESMAQEIREIFKYAFYTDSEPFSSIYTGNYTMLDSVLSNFYGIPGGGSQAMQFRRVDTSNRKRGGVIASGAYMASNAHMDQTSPIMRAVHVRQDVLCQSIPLPTNLEDSDAREEFAKILTSGLEAGNLSTTEYFHIQTAIPGTSCETCHKSIINPMFAIDDFDNVGLPRPTVGGAVVQTGEGDNGLPNIPVDAVNNGGWLYSGDVVGKLGSGEADKAQQEGRGIQFSGAKDLGQKMVQANLPGIDACLIEKSARYALGHYLNPAFEDEGIEKPLSDTQKSHMSCVMSEMESAYRANNGSPRAAFKAIGLSDAVRFRQ